MGELSRVLMRVSQGDTRASDELLSLVYSELLGMARQQVAWERPGQTLSATALVHEAYLRLTKEGELGSWNSRAHFFSAAGEAMRRILIDVARRKRALKHGGDWNRVTLDPSLPDLIDDDDRLLSLNVALDQLAANKPQVAELVKLRYFAGLTIDEAAECLGVSDRTAKYWWAFAKAWLRAAIEESE